MKTIFAITAITMFSSLAIADWEDVWKNPDLDPKFGSGYDMHFEPVQPSADSVISLEDFYRNNPDVSSEVAMDDSTMEQVGGGVIAATSLDMFTQQNPDQYDGFEIEVDSGDEMPGNGITGIGDSPSSF